MARPISTRIRRTGASRSTAGHRLGHLRPRRARARTRSGAARSRSWARSSSASKPGRAAKSIRGLVIMSGKEKGFIVGADVREFEQLHTTMDSRGDRASGPCSHARPHRGAAGAGGCWHPRLSASAAGWSWCWPATAASPRATTAPGSASPRCGSACSRASTAPCARSARPAPLSAMQTMLTGSMVGASAARAMGLVDELVAEPAEPAWAARKAIELQKRKSKPAGGWRALLRHWPMRAAARQQDARRDRQEGARGPLSRAVPADRPLRAHGGDLGRMKTEETRCLRAAHGVGDLAQSAPRLQAVGDAEGPGAQGRGLQAAARPRHRRRRHGRRHRRLVRRLRHGGDAAGSVRGADPKGIDAQGKLFARKFRTKALRDAAKARFIADPKGYGASAAPTSSSRPSSRSSRSSRRCSRASRPSSSPAPSWPPTRPRS